MCTFIHRPTRSKFLSGGVAHTFSESPNTTTGVNFSSAVAQPSSLRKIRSSTWLSPLPIAASSSR